MTYIMCIFIRNLTKGSDTFVTNMATRQHPNHEILIHNVTKIFLQMPLAVSIAVFFSCLYFMIISLTFFFQDRNVIPHPHVRWTNQIVPYVIDPAISKSRTLVKTLFPVQIVCYKML